jgi:hypothetical protein
MGQCVLRDMGFQLEKDAQKKAIIERYIQDRMKVEYPKAKHIRLQKNFEEDSDYGDDIKLRRMGKSMTSEDQNGRLSRSAVKKAKVKEMMIQTDDLMDVSFRKSRTLTPTNFTSANNNDGSKSPNKAVSFADGAKQDGHRRVQSFSPANGENTLHIKLQTPKSISEAYNSEATDSSVKGNNRRQATSGDNKPTTPSGRGGNIFNGIERIDFKEPAKAETFTTGRSRSTFKGFENKYFRISGHRSPSPMNAEHHQNVFDDDDEDEFPYDDY